MLDETVNTLVNAIKIYNYAFPEKILSHAEFYRMQFDSNLPLVITYKEQLLVNKKEWKQKDESNSFSFLHHQF